MTDRKELIDRIQRAADNLDKLSFGFHRLVMVARRDDATNAFLSLTDLIGSMLIQSIGNVSTMLDAVMEVRREHQGLRDEYHEALGDSERVRKQMKLHYQKESGNYWAWQGDGSDHLESLTCPILIQAEELRELIERKE